MRSLLLLLCVSACTIEIADDAANDPADDSDSSSNPTDEGGGGLPTPACGSPLTGQTVGCSVHDGLCFGLDWSFDLGIGRCVARSEGTLTAQIAGIGFTATGVAAIADDAYLQVSAISLGAALTFRVPAIVGTHDCGSGSVAILHYYDGITDYWNRITSPRPACSITITAIGAVGARIEGSFSATLAAGQTALDVTAGTFSVARAPY